MRKEEALLAELDRKIEQREQELLAHLAKGRETRNERISPEKILVLIVSGGAIVIGLILAFLLLR
jgi:hypothetical protein